MRIACNSLKYSDALFDNSDTVRTHRSCNDSGRESFSAKLEILQDRDFQNVSPWNLIVQTNKWFIDAYRAARWRVVGISSVWESRGRKSLVVFIFLFKYSLIHNACTYKTTLSRSGRFQFLKVIPSLFSCFPRIPFSVGSCAGLKLALNFVKLHSERALDLLNISVQLGGNTPLS